MFRIVGVMTIATDEGSSMVSKQVETIVNALHNETSRFISSLIDVGPEGSACPPRQLGTGWFLEGENGGYLVTARHVVSQASDPSRIGFSRDNGAMCVRPDGCWALADGADLAIASLGSTIQHLQPKSVLPRERVASHSDPLDDDVLFIHGFPAQRSFVLAKGIATKSHGLATTKFSDLGAPDASPRFLIRYSSEGIQKSDGSPGECPDPRGMSGCPVWRANWNGHIATWRPELATVVGVAIEWSQQFPALVVEPVQRIRQFLTGHM